MIIDADAEHLLIDYLNQALPANGCNVPVADRVPPDTVPAITLVRTGGARRDLVTDQAQITVDVRHHDNGQAASVIGLVRALLNDLWGGTTLAGHPVYSVREVSGPYSNPTAAELFRYSQSFLVAVRATRAL